MRSIAINQTTSEAARQTAGQVKSAKKSQGPFSLFKIFTCAGFFALMITSQFTEAQTSSRPAEKTTDKVVRSEEWATRPAPPGNDTVFAPIDGEKGSFRVYLYHRPDVLKETGVLRNGNKEGVWRKYYSTGMPEQFMTFVGGQPNGGAFTFYQNGFIKLETNFKDGKKDGYYRNYEQAGGKSTLKAEANYKDGEYHGRFVQYMANGSKMQESHYQNGVKNGQTIWYYSNGKIALEQKYVDGKFEGTQTAYYESGRAQTVSNHKNNELNGNYENYFESGQLESKGKYKDGKRTGKWEFYKEDGSLLRTENN